MTDAVRRRGPGLGPKKPRKPPEVKNAKLNAQRQAEYERLMAVYEQHRPLYKPRATAAAKQLAGNAAAGEAQPPKRAKPEPNPAPSPASKQPTATVEPESPPPKLRKKNLSGFVHTPLEDQLGRESDEHLVQFSQEPAAGSWPVRLPPPPLPPSPLPQPSPAGPRTPSLLELLRLEDLLVPPPPSPNVVKDFDTLLDASRLVRHLKPGGAGCGAGVEVLEDLSLGAWLEATCAVLREQNVGASVNLGRGISAHLVKKGDGVAVKICGGPVPYGYWATLAQLLRMLGEAGALSTVEERHAAWNETDPDANAQRASDWFAEHCAKQWDSQTELMQAAAEKEEVSGRTHKAALYVATLHPELVKRFNFPENYAGIFCRKAVYTSAGRKMVWHVLKLFGDRQGGHLSAAEKTEQCVSFQVVLSIVGEEGFDWRPVLVWPDLPAGDDYGSLLSADAVTKDCELGPPDEQRAWCAKATIKAGGGPWPAMLNLTWGEEGCSRGDASAGLLGSVAGYALALALWSEVKEMPEMHKYDAVFKGIKVGQLWSRIRINGTWMKGYPERQAAFSELGFEWGVWDAAAEHFVGEMERHVHERTQVL